MIYYSPVVFSLFLFFFVTAILLTSLIADSFFTVFLFVGRQTLLLRSYRGETEIMFPFAPFYPKTFIKRAWVGIFKSNSHNVESQFRTYIFKTAQPIPSSNKSLPNAKDRQVLFVGCPYCPKLAYNKSKMVNGYTIWKEYNSVSKQCVQVFVLEQICVRKLLPVYSDKADGC